MIADQLALFRSGIAAQLEALELVCCAEVQTSREAIDCLYLEPKLVIVGSLLDADLAMTVALLKAPMPAPLVLVLAPLAERHDIAGLLAAGADGVLRRSASVVELQHAISAVLQGERFIAPTLTRELAGTVVAVIDVREGTGAASSLSAREREMLLFLTQGCTNREIAESLCLSVATVKSHLIRLYAKLGVNSRSEALGAAVALGLVA